VKLQTELISDKELQKLQNKYENQYVNSNASIEGVASNLATYYMLYNDVNLINTEIEMYRTITPEDIRTVAKKYLNPNQRLVLDYVPSDKAKKIIQNYHEKNNIYTIKSIFFSDAGTNNPATNTISSSDN
jgi:predicted Zn-dependent peptidase